MNNLKNNVNLIGNLGNDPEIKSFNDDQGKLARFSLATSDSYKNKDGEWVNNTTWHNIVAWNKTAELIEKLAHKGTHMAVQGKLINRSYENANGENKYITEIELNDFLLLDKKDK